MKKEHEFGRQEYEPVKNYDYTWKDFWEEAKNGLENKIPFPELVEQLCEYYEEIKPIKHIKVHRFSDEMQKELDNNSHKGDWQNFKNVSSITEEFRYHLGKLENLKGDSDPTVIREHIADCANILMFLGNAYNLYDE